MSDRKFLSVLPWHSTGTERALERAGLWVEGNDFSNDTWNPDNCPEHLLPWLAWSLSVEVFDSRWPVEIRRNVIRSSIEVHRKHGTLGGLKTALAALGVDIRVTEWFDTGARPYTFSIKALATVDLIGDPSIPLLSSQLRDQVMRVIDSVKPVRAHYDLAFLLRFTGARSIAAGTVIRSRACRRLDPAIRASGAGVGGLGAGFAVRGRARRSFAPKVLACGLAPRAMAAGLRVIHRQRLELPT